MKKLFTILLVALAACVYGQLPNVSDTAVWKNIFTDDFNGTRLNKKLWDTKYPWNQTRHDSACICDCNTEKPVYEQKAYVLYQNDTHNVQVKNGSVKIYTRKEDFEGEFWDWDKDEYGNEPLKVTHHMVNHTTGILYSKKTYNRGYYEIRFKLPPAPPLLASYAVFGPDFWTFSGDCWNEIDGFEVINGQQRTFTSNLHYELPPTMVGADTICDPLIDKSPRHVQEHVNIGSITDDEWHVAAFDWQDNLVIFYLDGKEYYRSKRVPVDMLKPMNMIVGIASPLTNICSRLNSPFTKYPYVFEVDYIKIWERKKP